MAEPEKHSHGALGGAEEEAKAVAIAGPAGVLLVTMIVLGIVAIVVLGVVLLISRG